MKSYLSAVRHLQIMSGLGDPFVSEMPRLQYVLKGARIERSKLTPGAKRSRLPITPALLLKMKDVLSKNGRDFNNIMLWAAVCVCYFGFMRSGELTVPSLNSYCPQSHLSMNDVSVDRAGRPEIISFQKGRDYLRGQDRQTAVPSGSPIGLPVGAGWPGGASVPTLRSASFDKGRLRGSCEENSDPSRCGRPELCGPQLPDRGGYGSSNRRSGRLLDPNIGSVEE